MKNDCRKFSPNVFNKQKCAVCFKQKEEHSNEALDSNKAARRVQRCGYLFVAADWDFSIPLNRTKRWQRRWFVLYDDGELTYSVDDHPETVPQCVIDVTRVREVAWADDVTGNQHSVALTAVDRITFFKGSCKEEASWWMDALSVYVSAIKGRNKRNATFPGLRSVILSDNNNNNNNNNNNQDNIENNNANKNSDHNNKNNVENNKTTAKSTLASADTIDTGHKHQQKQKHGVFLHRRLAGCASTPLSLRLPTAHDTISAAPAVDKMADTADAPESPASCDDVVVVKCVRKTSVDTAIPNTHTTTPHAIHNRNNCAVTPLCRAVVVEDGVSVSVASAVNSTTAAVQSRGIPDGCVVSAISRTPNNNNKNNNSSGCAGGGLSTHNHSPLGSCRRSAMSSTVVSTRPVTTNTTTTTTTTIASKTPLVDDAKPSPKAGWLLRLSAQKNWIKQWAVLRRGLLIFYRSPTAELTDLADGVIDLARVQRVTACELARSYGLRLATWNGASILLSALTAALRASWLHALRPVVAMTTTTSPHSGSSSVAAVRALGERCSSVGGSSSTDSEDGGSGGACDVIGDVTGGSAARNRAWHQRSLSPTPASATEQTASRNEPTVSTNEQSAERSMTVAGSDTRSDTTSAHISHFSQREAGDSDRLPVTVSNSVADTTVAVNASSTAQQLLPYKRAVRDSTVHSPSTNRDPVCCLTSKLQHHRCTQTDQGAAVVRPNSPQQFQALEVMQRHSDVVVAAKNSEIKRLQQTLRSKDAELQRVRAQAARRRECDGSCQSDVIKMKDLVRDLRALLDSRSDQLQRMQRELSESRDTITSLKQQQQQQQRTDQLTTASDRITSTPADDGDDSDDAEEDVVDDDDDDDESGCDHRTSADLELAPDEGSRTTTVDHQEQEQCVETSSASPREALDERDSRCEESSTSVCPQQKLLMQRLHSADACVQQLHRQLRDAHDSCHRLQLDSCRQLQAHEARENMLRSEMRLLTDRLNDLTAKLLQVEKQLRETRQRDSRGVDPPTSSTNSSTNYTTNSSTNYTTPVSKMSTSGVSAVATHDRQRRRRSLSLKSGRCTLNNDHSPDARRCQSGHSDCNTVVQLQHKLAELEQQLAVIEQQSTTTTTVRGYQHSTEASRMRGISRVDSGGDSNATMGGLMLRAERACARAANTIAATASGTEAAIAAPSAGQNEQQLIGQRAKLSLRAEVQLCTRTVVRRSRSFDHSHQHNRRQSSQQRRHGRQHRRRRSDVADLFSNNNNNNNNDNNNLNSSGLKHYPPNSCATDNLPASNQQPDIQTDSDAHTCTNCQHLHDMMETARVEHNRQQQRLRTLQNAQLDQLKQEMTDEITRVTESYVSEKRELCDQVALLRARLTALEREYDQQVAALSSHTAATHTPPPPSSPPPTPAAVTSSTTPLMVGQNMTEQRCQREIEQLRAMCERGVAAMRRSHQRHLATLQADKERMLAELEQLRGAHQRLQQAELHRWRQHSPCSAASCPSPSFFTTTASDGRDDDGGGDLTERRISDGASTAAANVTPTDDVSGCEVGGADVAAGLAAGSLCHCGARCVPHCTATLHEQINQLTRQLHTANQQVLQLDARNKQLRAQLSATVQQLSHTSAGSPAEQLRLTGCQLTAATEQLAELRHELSCSQQREREAAALCEKLASEVSVYQRRVKLSQHQLPEQQHQQYTRRHTGPVAGRPANARLTDKHSATSHHISAPRSSSSSSSSSSVASSPVKMAAVQRGRATNVSQNIKHLLRSPSCPRLSCDSALTSSPSVMTNTMMMRGGPGPLAGMVASRKMVFERAGAGLPV